MRSQFVGARRRRLERRKIAVEFELTDVGFVRRPFRTFVTKEPFKDVFAQCLGHKFRTFHHVDRIRKGRWQLTNPGFCGLGWRHLGQVLGELRPEFVTFFDALQPGC